jgi:hypothetical protein
MKLTVKENVIAKIIDGISADKRCPAKCELPIIKNKLK